jgi:hypothetical protein
MSDVEETKTTVDVEALSKKKAEETTFAELVS